MTNRLSIFLGLCLAGCGVAVPAVAAAEAEDMSAEEFLCQVRRPFREEAWGRFRGRVVHVRSGRKQRAKLTLAIAFSSDSVRAKLVLDERNAYLIEQVDAADGPPKVNLKLPEDEQDPKLFDLGIEAEDVTFSFIHWDLVKELPAESIRRHKCRVLELSHPDKQGCVRAWFSCDYLFPLRAHWRRPDEEAPWRRLEFKGFKKSKGGLWFMKTAHLRGSDWKTQLKFDECELHRVCDAPVPAGLLGGPAVGAPEEEGAAGEAGPADKPGEAAGGDAQGAEAE